MASSSGENMQAAMSIDDHSQPATSADSTKKRKQVDEGEQPSKKTKLQDAKAPEELPKVGPSSRALIFTANIFNRGLEVGRSNVAPCFESLQRGKSC
jgi:hypothetical protein